MNSFYFKKQFTISFMVIFLSVGLNAQDFSSMKIKGTYTNHLQRAGIPCDYFTGVKQPADQKIIGNDRC